MKDSIPPKKTLHFNSKKLVIPGDRRETIEWSARYFVELAQQAIDKKGKFLVALSGGSTPKEIFKVLTQSDLKAQVDWSKVWLFWSDERDVALTHPESNYKMAMDSGFEELPIPSQQIFPMEITEDKEASARAYHEHIENHAKEGFDLILLGVGEDGHTASLFPGTKANKLPENSPVHATMNWVPQKECWRMTMTFSCIQKAKECTFYVLGSHKSQILTQVMHNGLEGKTWPASKVGSTDYPSLWVADIEAAELFMTS